MEGKEDEVTELEQELTRMKTEVKGTYFFNGYFLLHFCFINVL